MIYLNQILCNIVYVTALIVQAETSSKHSVLTEKTLITQTDIKV